MKKAYISPAIDVEVYVLDASIAGNCHMVVDLGPDEPGHQACDSYYDQIGIPMLVSIDAASNIDFYEDTNCKCYTTGGEKGFFTS